MIDKILSMIRKEYHMRSLDAGVYHKLVIRGMNFEINSYEATELGRVATMCATGMFGLVKRDLLIVSPLEKNAPVVSYERVKAFGKDTLLMAKYDLEKDALYLKESGKKKQSAELDAKTESFFEEYLSEVRTAEKVQVKVRKEKVEALVDGLIEEARLSSDIFMVTYSKNITEKLYHNVMFGTR